MQPVAGCTDGPANGDTSPAQQRDENVLSKGRKKAGTDQQRDGKMKAQRITGKTPIGSNPTTFTQQKVLSSRGWVQQGTRAGWSKAEPTPDLNTVFTHTAFLPIASVMPQIHSSLKRGFRDMQGQHPYHLHLPENSIFSTAPSAPAQGTTAPHPPGHSNDIFLLSFLLVPRDSLSPSMVFALWVGGLTGTWTRAMDSPLWQEQKRGPVRAWVLSKGGEGAWAVHAKLDIPALPVPVPLLPCPCAMPTCLPSSSTTAPVPSLPSPPRFCVCFFFPCASSLRCFSPSQLLLLSSLCSIPAHPLCAAMTAKSTGSCMVWQQAQPRELWHHLGAAAPPMLPLTQKAAVEAAASSAVVGRIRGCPAPLGASGACMFCLHPLAGLCLRQLPEELTHFWPQQSRGCSVSLALLSLCLSLIFDV